MLHFLFNWIEVGVVWLGRSKICRDECSSLALKEVDRLARPMRWGTVLLKDEGWGSIDLDSGIEEYQTGVA